MKTSLCLLTVLGLAACSPDRDFGPAQAIPAGLYAGWQTNRPSHGDFSRYLIFFPNGEVVQRFPKTGLDGFDCARDQTDNWGDWGICHVSRGDLTIEWNTAPTVVARINRDGSLAYDGYTIRRMDPCHGLRLDGHYRFPGRAETILFTAGGTYSTREFLLAPHRLAGPGRYEVRNNTIHFYPESGQTVSTLLFYPAGPPGNSLWMGQRMIEKI